MTGGNTDHHTTADLQHIDVRTISSSISCVDFLSTPLVKGSCFQCLARFGPPRTAGCMGDDASNLKLSCFGYGMAGMASMSAVEKEKQRLHKCISREPNPGHIDGKYSTTRPLMLLTKSFRGGNSIRASRIWRRSSADPQKQWISHYKGFQSNGVSFNKALPLKVICFFWGISFYSNPFCITGFPF